MIKQVRAKDPFKFCTRLHLSELTGLKAATLGQLLTFIKIVPESSIYHHTHIFLQYYHYLFPEPANDFAYWINEVLKESPLGDKLLRIDTIQFSSLDSLRGKIAVTIEDYLNKNQFARMKFAPPGEEFHFIKSVSFILPTDYLAYDLNEFLEILDKITLDSVYFHVFESRLRLNNKANDFSNWIETSLGYKDLAQEIVKLNPYLYTLEELKNKIIKLITSKSDF